MSKKILKFSIKFFILFAIFTLLFSSIVFFSLRNKKNVFAIEDGDIGGWFWSPLLGWVSQSCSNRYYDNYQNYCGITTKQAFLDVNFDGSDFLINTSKVIDNSENNIVGKYQLFDGVSFANKLITVENIRNRKLTSNYDTAFYGFNNSAIEFDHENFMAKSNDHDFSVSLWLKVDPEKIEDEKKVFLFSNGQFDTNNSKYYCYLYRVFGSRQIRIVCGVGDTKIDEPINIDSDIWYNVTFVSTETNEIKLYFNYSGDAQDCFSVFENGCHVSDGLLGVQYINGVLPNTNAFNKKLILGNMVTERSLDNYTSGFPGSIDEFRFFTLGLTASEVKINIHHNSNYGLNMDSSGNLSGWTWSSHYGWICFGKTCYDNNFNSPTKIDTKLHLNSSPTQGIFQYMITGWAKIIGLNKENSDLGWISLNTNKVIVPESGDITYLDCSSCSLKDSESGLISYWKMDEQSGSAISDYSGFNNIATLSSNNENFSYPNGVANNCIYLDGDDYIQANNVYEINDGDFSIETWVKPLGLEDVQNIISSPGGLNLRIEGDNQIKLDFMSFSDGVDYNFNDDWNHIVISVKNGATVRLYINKIMIIEFQIDNYKDLILKDLIIGSDTNHENNFFGYVDLFRFYKKALSENEIEYNYNYPEKRLCSACFYVRNAMNSINVCYDCNKCYLNGIENNCKSCTECRQYGLFFNTNSSNIKGFAWSGPDPNGGIGEDGLGWIKFSPTLSAGLYRSYISAQYGNIYSGANIGTETTIVPPIGQYNATYLIQANGNITNWISEQMVIRNQQDTIVGFDYSSKWLDQGVNYEFPTQSNSFGNILGSLDYEGIVGGEYGEVEKSMPQGGYLCLGGRIYKPDKKFFIDGQLFLTPEMGMEDVYIFMEKGGCDNASGIFVIDGDLMIEGNMRYDNHGIDTTEQLASVVWVIRGDLYINPSVTRLAGTFIVLGGIDEDGGDIECGDVNNPESRCGIIYTGDSNQQLIVHGQFLAKNFQFQRKYKSDFREPAELIIYDGRNIINPPPGLGDAIKSLPRWDQIAPY
ncbi:MAG TPA: hypothetical protein PKL13_02950 [bacterium]|nr:hypothetical protein [bacterium]